MMNNYSTEVESRVEGSKERLGEEKRVEKALEEEGEKEKEAEEEQEGEDEKEKEREESEFRTINDGLNGAISSKVVVVDFPHLLQNKRVGEMESMVSSCSPFSYFQSDSDWNLFSNNKTEDSKNNNPLPLGKSPSLMVKTNSNLSFQGDSSEINEAALGQLSASKSALNSSNLPSPGNNYCSSGSSASSTCTFQSKVRHSGTSSSRDFCTFASSVTHYPSPKSSCSIDVPKCKSEFNGFSSVFDNNISSLPDSPLVSISPRGEAEDPEVLARRRERRLKRERTRQERAAKERQEREAQAAKERAEELERESLEALSRQPQSHLNGIEFFEDISGPDRRPTWMSTPPTSRQSSYRSRNSSVVSTLKSEDENDDEEGEEESDDCPGSGRESFFDPWDGKAADVKHVRPTILKLGLDTSMLMNEPAKPSEEGLFADKCVARMKAMMNRHNQHSPYGRNYSMDVLDDDYLMHLCSN